MALTHKSKATYLDTYSQGWRSHTNLKLFALQPLHPDGAQHKPKTSYLDTSSPGWRSHTNEKLLALQPLHRDGAHTQIRSRMPWHLFTGMAHTHKLKAVCLTTSSPGWCPTQTKKQLTLTPLHRDGAHTQIKSCLPWHFFTRMALTHKWKVACLTTSSTGGRSHSNQKQLTLTPLHQDGAHTQTKNN